MSTHTRRGARLVGHVRLIAVLVVLLGVLEMELPSWAQADPSYGTVYIQTVPALSGVRLTVEGTEVTTSGLGAGVVSVADINGIASHVQLASSQAGPTTFVSISRILSGAHLPRESHLTIGLDVRSRVNLALSAGTDRVPLSLVHEVRLHSVTGTIKDIDPRGNPTVTMESRRVHLVSGALVAQRVTWSVDRVQSSSGLAFTTAQPTFDPLYHGTWPLVVTTVKGNVRIDTVPRTPGVVFLLEGATATTGPDGSAVVPVTDLNNLDRQLRLDTQQAGPLRVSNARIRRMPPPGIRQRRLLVALDVWRPVRLRFIDHAGTPVPLSRISSVQLSADNTLRSLSGVDLQSPALLLKTVAMDVGGHWQSRPVTYSVLSVGVDGSNAVFSGTQRFRPVDGGTWTVTLSVFALKIVASDALLGIGVSSGAVLVRPDGSTMTVRLGRSGEVRIDSLGRGTYTMQLEAAAVGSRTTVLVSRDDVVKLRVVTLTDALIVSALFLILLGGMVVVGVVVAARRAAAAAADETRPASAMGADGTDEPSERTATNTAEVTAAPRRTEVRR